MDRNEARSLSRPYRSLLPAIALLVSLLPFSIIPLPADAHPAEFERIEILSQRIETRPLDPSLYIDRGASYSHDGEYAKAMQDLQKAADLGDPVLPAYQLGLLRHRMGERTKARAEFNRFLERFPNHAGALEKRARLLAELGETQAAVSDYERMFELTPRPNPGSYLSAAKLLAADTEFGGPTALEPALAMLDRGIVRLGVIAQLQQAAIELELQGGQKDRARERLESLKPTLGGGPDWDVQMAELLIDVGKLKPAGRHLASARGKLERLRETPARRALGERITNIQETIEGQ